MECNVEIEIPEECRRLDQNEEWVRIITDQAAKKVRLHDYGSFYKIPGLYDEFYKGLKCRSPQVVCEALKNEMAKHGEGREKIRALDFGAGNGQVGESLSRNLDCRTLVGLDIIPEAKEAAERDRPGLYEEYYVMDMADPTDEDMNELSRWDFNTLITVAALGFGDICTRAFANTYNLLKKDGWVAFNIKARFLSDRDESGFNEFIENLVEGGFELLESRRYCHRYSLAGEPLYYYVMVGRKTGDLVIN